MTDNPTYRRLCEWWHKRTDGVNGISKLVGEEGSMFREHVVKPIGLLLLAAIVWWWIK